jgi:zinc/manganese transport system substrate-binding protein
MRLSIVLAAGLLGLPAVAAEPLKVVASFSLLGDLVAQVGGDHVTVRTIVGANSDAHVYEPTPADARDTTAADLVVVNGFGFEGWLDRLVEASGYSGPVAVASNGVATIDIGDEAASGRQVETMGNEAELEQGNVDPHAWQAVANAEVYVKNIISALCSADADAEDCADYKANGAAYLAELTALDTWIKSTVAVIPPLKRKVITTHDAFGYFAREYGVTFLAPQGVSTEAEASAGDVARLIDQIRQQGVTALFLENISDPRLIEQIANETGVTAGGELYSDALSEPEGPAATYIEMMRHNAILLTSAMLGSS